MTQQNWERDFLSTLESLNVVLPLVKDVVDLGGKESKPSFTAAMWMQVWRREQRTRRSLVLNFLAALVCLGAIVYTDHSQSSLTASVVSLVRFPEAALVSGTLAIGHHSESCTLCTGNILQGQVPPALWQISTSPETIRVCRNYSSRKKKVFWSVKIWYLVISI